MTIRQKIKVAQENGILVEYKEYGNSTFVITRVDNVFFTTNRFDRIAGITYLTKVLLDKGIYEYKYKGDGDEENNSKS